MSRDTSCTLTASFYAQPYPPAPNGGRWVDVAKAAALLTKPIPKPPIEMRPSPHWRRERE